MQNIVEKTVFEKLMELFRRRKIDTSSIVSEEQFEDEIKEQKNIEEVNKPKLIIAENTEVIEISKDIKIEKLKEEVEIPSETLLIQIEKLEDRPPEKTLIFEHKQPLFIKKDETLVIEKIDESVKTDEIKGPTIVTEVKTEEPKKVETIKSTFKPRRIVRRKPV